jgi:hypothetical protein
MPIVLLDKVLYSTRGSKFEAIPADEMRRDVTFGSTGAAVSIGGGSVRDSHDAKQL